MRAKDYLKEEKVTGGVSGHYSVTCSFLVLFLPINYVREEIEKNLTVADNLLQTL